MSTIIGILLTNTGTPDSPHKKAVRRYLKEFLSDRRIVKIPKLFWLPLLYAVILPLRSRRSAKLYQSIWESDAPMRRIMFELQDKLQAELAAEKTQYHVEIGMNYGNPSIESALNNLKQKQITQLIVLPLYPQYSTATTASSFDRTSKMLKTWQNPPAFIFNRDFHDDKNYIASLTERIELFWQREGRGEHLLISFHGLPEKFIHAGDPYQQQCEATAALLTKSLKIPKSKWTLCYQSRFGYGKWLQPQTHSLLTTFPCQKIEHLDVVCPGFSIDCLETLEEIADRAQRMFLSFGGKSLRYIPALNSEEAQINLLKNITLVLKAKTKI